MNQTIIKFEIIILLEFISKQKKYILGGLFYVGGEGVSYSSLRANDLKSQSTCEHLGLCIQVGSSCQTTKNTVCLYLGVTKVLPDVTKGAKKRTLVKEFSKICINVICLRTSQKEYIRKIKLKFFE